MIEEVYVVYHEGRPYLRHGRKTAYLNRSGAKSVITTESKGLAEERTPDYWGYSREERSRIAKEIAENEFEIITYVPKTEGR